MANDLNYCSFIGRLGRDVETRFAPSGDAIANFSIAVGEQWKGKNGEKQEKTTWVRVVMFGKLAEIAAQYVHKGDQVFISGKLQVREWEKDGQKHQTSEIVADRMQMLGGKSDQGERRQEQQERPQQRQERPQQRQEQRQGNSGGPAKRAPSGDFDEPFNDDIPFASASNDITGTRLQRRLKRGRV